MPVPDFVLKQINCCLSGQDDSHVLIDPVILKCGGNACKVCVGGSSKCLHCHIIHSNYDFTECKLGESLIRCFIKDLSANLDEEIRSTKDLLKGFYLFYFVQNDFKVSILNRRKCS